MSYQRGNLRRRAFGRRPGNAPYARNRHQTSVQLPFAKPDHELVGDGTERGRRVARANDAARVAREWRTHFEKSFEDKNVTVRPPAGIQRVPGAGVLAGKLEAAGEELIGKWRVLISGHLTEAETTATERAASPPSSEHELLAQAVATAVHAAFAKLTTTMNGTK